jgi:hypothetical protein
MEIRLGSVGDFHSRPDCSLCAFLSETIEKTFPENDSQDQAWIAKPAYLRFAFQESRINGSQGVKLYLCIGEEHTQNHALLRVYDNRNFDQILPEIKSAIDASPPRLISQTIDWKYFQRLTYNCGETHPGCYYVGHRAFPTGFRLIDVNQRKVVRMGNNEVPPYMALSYVWGQNPDNKYLLTKERIDEFEREGSLLHLPRTIEDSFEVCICFYIPYI